ncbi:hypothetical protein AAG906_030444 [Vitis piasezkii]
MEPPKPSNPLLSFSTFIHQHCLRLGAELVSRLDDTRRLAGNWPPSALRHSLLLSSLSFASVSQEACQTKRDLGGALSSDHMAKSLVGTVVYTISNSNNEFVLISDPNGIKSIGLLCFRQEDAEAFLAQVQTRTRELRSQARVVPISLDQVYMLKVEGIAFRFLPDPVQIKNALELKAADIKSGFDGVPVFQVFRPAGCEEENRRYCPIYFQKEDIVKELSKVSRSSRGPGVTQHIMVGSLEDVLRKWSFCFFHLMQTSEKNSGWEDLIFIPPGKSHSQHIQEVTKR